MESKNACENFMFHSGFSGRMGNFHFFIPFPYVPFLFHAVPRKKNAGTGENDNNMCITGMTIYVSIAENSFMPNIGKG